MDHTGRSVGRSVGRTKRTKRTHDGERVNEQAGIDENIHKRGLNCVAGMHGQWDHTMLHAFEAVFL